MLILDEVLGEHWVGATPSVGTSWAIHVTSTGKVLLAHHYRLARAAKKNLNRRASGLTRLLRKSSKSVTWRWARPSPVHSGTQSEV